jgi:hypothetical protein
LLLLLLFCHARLRYASPVEESKRTWRVRPSAVDLELATKLPFNYPRLVQPYGDPDGDDALAKQVVLDRLARRKSVIAAHGGSKK